MAFVPEKTTEREKIKSLGQTAHIRLESSNSLYVCELANTYNFNSFRIFAFFANYCHMDDESRISDARLGFVVVNFIYMKVVVSWIFSFIRSDRMRRNNIDATRKMS